MHDDSSKNCGLLITFTLVVRSAHKVHRLGLSDSFTGNGAVIFNTKNVKDKSKGEGAPIHAMTT